MRLRDVKAYIFDLDDTLYDEEQFVNEGMSSVAEYASKKYNIAFSDLMCFCEESLHRDGRGHTFNDMCSYFDLKEDPKELVKIYRNCSPKIELYDDAKELLEAIKKRGFKIGLITDGCATVQRNKAKALGIYDLCDSLVFTDELEKPDGSRYSKPDEYVYEKSIRELAVSANDAVYIGDNLLKDFVGAKKLGIKTVRIIRDKGMYMKEEAPSKEYEADYSVHSLRELME